MTDGRVTTTSGRLVRLGFEDVERASRTLDRLGAGADVLDAPRRHHCRPGPGPGVPRRPRRPCPGPGRPAPGAGRRRGHRRCGCSRCSAPARPSATTCCVIRSTGATSLTRRSARPGPPAFAVRDSLLRAVGRRPAGRRAGRRTVTTRACVDALRVEYRRLLLRLAARDLAHDRRRRRRRGRAVRPRGRHARRRARHRPGPGRRDRRIGPARRDRDGQVRRPRAQLRQRRRRDLRGRAGRRGTTSRRRCGPPPSSPSNLMRICSDHTGEGTIWPVDAALRPEGKSGPLVRTLASHEGYYQQLGEDLGVPGAAQGPPGRGRPRARSAVRRHGRADGVVGRPSGTASSTTSRRCAAGSIEHIPAAHAERQLKLGSGGLRDVEFAVQLLQLVHGRADERGPRRHDAVGAGASSPRAGTSDARTARPSTRRTASCARSSTACSCRSCAAPTSCPRTTRRCAGWAARWASCASRSASSTGSGARHSREVRRLHEKLFYRPLLAAVARLPADEARLSPKAAEQQLAALGYEDPRAALRHLEALTAGVSRSSNIQRTLLPAMLGWFADAPNPDAGLFGFRQISEALGSTHWYLQTLRDEGQVAQRLATVLAVEPLRHRPAASARPRACGCSASDEALEPLSRAALQKEMPAAARRHTDPVEAVTAIRAIRRRELFRIAVGDLLGARRRRRRSASPLTDVTAATLEAALTVAWLAVEAERRAPLPTRMAIVAMGRFGGFELSLRQRRGRDVRARPAAGRRPARTASAYAHDVANELRRLLSLPGTDPALVVDADLRPEGKQGPLVRTLESYAALLRASGRWSGRRRRCCGPTRWSATRTCCRAVHRADRPAALPGRRDQPRTTYWRSAGSRPASTTSGCRAAPTRPPTSSSAGAGSPTWSGPSSCCRCSTPAPVPGLRTPRTLDALEAAVDADLLERRRRRGARGAWRTVERAAQRDHAGARQARRPAAARHPRTGRGGAHPAATRRASPTRWSTTTCGSPGGPAQVVERVFWG